MKSILQENKKQCYICKKIFGFDYEQKTEEHHIFPGNNRNNSEKYGLKVYLCPNHHQFGEDAVHRMPNEGYDLLLKQIAQARFKQTYPDLDFLTIFGKSYL
jgi:hypothetical protein